MPVETPVLDPVLPGPAPHADPSPAWMDQFEATLSGPWIVILYNDDWHPIDQVVFQVQKATGCSLEKATWITLEAHHLGRAVAFTGSKEECERVTSVLRDIQLQVEIDRA